jgi:poly-gamma-glutamate synthesis protein (capsule biosynthesis protein)
MAVTLMAVGDLMFGRKVESARRGRTDPDPLAAVREVLSSADLTVGNLECVLGTEGDFREWSSYDKIRLGAPADSVRFLTASGFDVVFLGNNHVLDFGKEGLESTARTLSGAGIGAVGWWAGQGVNRPVVLERKGVRFAFLAYSDVSPSYFKAGADSPGTIPPLSEILARDIRAARKIADWVVVSVHWGEEYRRVPTAKQRRIARDMVDRGADLVLGHHPHVIQPFEKYRGRVIAYSLGNFLFDLRNPRSRESLVLRVVFEKGWKPRVAWAPVEIQGTFPVFLEGEPAETAKRCLPWRLPKQAGKAPK